jgi:hypothetical protein
MLPTGDNSDLEEDDDYPEPNARATYAKAKFARIQPTIQKKTSNWMLSQDLQGQGQGKL